MDNRLKKSSPVWRRLPKWARVLLVVALAALAVRLLLWVAPFPQLNAFMHKENSTRFYDRNGVLLHVMPLEDGLRREYYSISDIPQNVQDAFIDAEDSNFYHHMGVDVISIIRAAVQNRQAGRVVSGASTITMQLVRMVVPRDGGVNLWVKFKEAFLAVLIEAKLSKKHILELYLNNVPFGFQIEGVGSASRSFFATTLDNLDADQIKTLASIPRRPSANAPQKIYSYPMLCPHLVQYVISQYHSEGEKLPSDVILSVNSTLVSKIEKEIQIKLDEFVDARIHNGSAFVINNRTGEIVAWVGNASYYDDVHSGQVDGVLVKNQPGSSMKPFLYALALEHGFEPTAVLPDIRQDFGSSGVYVPFNFNNRYNGPVRFRVSLASSLNVPAVYLLYHIGVDRYMQLLSKLGYRSLDGTRHTTGLSIALGSSEVSLYEMVRAFSVFPNDGLLLEPTFLYDADYWGGYEVGTKLRKTKDVKIKGKNRNEIRTKTSRVFNADIARIICDILSDKNARELGFGHAKVFDTIYPSMFKTGTSNQFQSIIALGATSEFSVGVWMGNFEGETVIGKTGSSIPAAVVREILDYLTKSYGASDFKQPQSYVKRDICALSGMAPGPNCPTVTQEYVHVKNHEMQDVQCTWHYLDESTGRTKIRYPSEYQHWASSINMAGRAYVDQSELAITYPNDGAVFFYDPSIPDQAQMITVMAVGGQENRAALFIDDMYVSQAQDVFSWSVPVIRGEHTLRVECGDESVTSTFVVR